MARRRGRPLAAQKAKADPEQTIQKKADESKLTPESLAKIAEAVAQEEPKQKKQAEEKGAKRSTSRKAIQFKATKFNAPTKRQWNQQQQQDQQKQQKPFEQQQNQRARKLDYKGKRRNDDGFPQDFDNEVLTPEELANTTILDITELQALSVPELNRRAKELNVDGVGSLSRHELLFEIVKSTSAEQAGIRLGGGVLEVLNDGYGFLRNAHASYIACPEDIYISPSQVKHFSLRTGDTVVGQIRQPKDKERFFALYKVYSVNGEDPAKKKDIVPFENLTPYFPTQRIILEHKTEELSTRIIDIVTPIGRGQRGLIVAAPRTGKTIILQKIANAITANNKDIDLIVLLIDERPEEVTDMKRVVKGEIVSSTFDEPPDRHVQVAEMVIEKAKRQVEYGLHVVILLDSITRLARAYNTIEPHSGRILTGGVDANALHKPKRFFGAARNIEHGGSLTIIATALVETGSKMDEVIFEEFKGTGNMELNLDRHMAEKRVYPAINVEKSGTRREELIVHPDELNKMWILRKAMLGAPPAEAMANLLAKLKSVMTNAEFLLTLKGLPEDYE